MAFRQFEVSDTWVFDRPQAGRMWFEGVIRDHLDVGRPDQIALIFHRRVNCRTPGRFRTRVIRRGVDPILCCYYKSSRIKQYFKEGRALRTETVICDTGDFGIGRRVCLQNWNALRAVGQSANRSLCDAEAADAQSAPDVATFCQVTRLFARRLFPETENTIITEEVKKFPNGKGRRSGLVISEGVA
jgi:hypothetical protein